MEKILILGDGAWGRAIYSVLKNNKKQVNIYNRKKNVLGDMLKAKPNFIVLAVPSSSISEVVRKVSKLIKWSCCFINVAKGFDKKTNDVWSKTIRKNIPENCQIVTLVGPSFAEEVVNKKLTAVNILCNNLTIAKKVASLFNNEYFKAIPLQDEIGGQVISALKNVLGIICGFVSTESANTKAAIFAQGVKEIQNIALSYGASQKTMMEFCGIGDIFLTCTDSKSRNFEFGADLRGQNINSKSCLKKETIEGLNALPIAFKYIKLNKICSPLISETYRLIFTKYNKNNFVKNVLF